jgi:uncharacterized protein YndB with AHSA1/START domain
VYSTAQTRHVRAPRAAVYRACVDADAVAAWMVPDGMTSRVHEFDPREGGAFRISLTYRDATGHGKSTAHTDTFHGRFVTLVPDERLVQTVRFETDDPALSGEMTITITLADSGAGTELRYVHDGVPDAVPAEQNEQGTRISLAKLAAIAEDSRTAASGRITP